MLAKMVRATFLLMVTMMVVAWAFSLGKVEAPELQDHQPTEQWYIYS